MPTTPNYLDIEVLSGDPSLGTETVRNTGTMTSGDTVTAATAQVPTYGDVTIDATGAIVTYTGYVTPDGGPILYFYSANSTSEWFALSNTLYTSTLAPVAMPTFTVACFTTGTLIRTIGGDVAVEDLACGDQVVTAITGEPAPIRWIGRRRVDCRRHPCPADVNPVRIAAHAFAPGRPRRDLVLSPDHAVYVDGVLVPVRHLVNDRTIRQEAVDEITYWHVELDRHDVLFAEELPAESYLDTGNRASFANVDVAALHATRERAAKESAATFELVEGGAVLAAIRSWLAERAATLAASVPDGFLVELGAVGRTEAILPAGTSRVRLVSRRRVPPGESRRLGACVSRIALDDQAVPLDAPALVSGFHGIESGQGSAWRWTNGEAVLALPPSPRALRLAIDIRMHMTVAA